MVCIQSSGWCTNCFDTLEDLAYHDNLPDVLFCGKRMQ